MSIAAVTSKQSATTIVHGALYVAPLLLVPLTWLCYINYAMGPGVSFDLRPLLFPLVIWFGARFGRIGLISYLVGAFPFGFITYGIDALTVGGYLGEYLACIALILVFSRSGAIHDRAASVFPRLQRLFLNRPVLAFLMLGLILNFYLVGLSFGLDGYYLFLVLMILLGCRASSEEIWRLLKAMAVVAVPVAIVWALNPLYGNGSIIESGDYTFGVDINHQLSRLMTDFANLAAALLIGRLIGGRFRDDAPETDIGTVLILAVLVVVFLPLRLSIGLNFAVVASRLDMSIALPVAYAFAFYLGSRHALRGVVAVAIAAAILFAGTGLLIAHLVTPDAYNTTVVLYDQTLDNGMQYYAQLVARDATVLAYAVAPLFAAIGFLAMRRYRRTEAV